MRVRVSDGAAWGGLRARGLTQPLVALYPLHCGPQNSSGQMLSPSVMSWKASGASAAIWYSSGLRKPKLLEVFVSAISLSSEATPAKIGEDIDVPPSVMMKPENTISPMLPTAATSGSPRPLAL